MLNYPYTRAETKRKHADAMIGLGEKFFYAAYITPLLLFAKLSFTTQSIVFSIAILTLFSFLGIKYLHGGLKIYDKIED